MITIDSKDLHLSIPIKDYHILIEKMEEMSNKLNKLLIEFSNDLSDLLTIKQAMSFLQCSKPTLYKLLSKHPEVRPVKFGERGIRYKRGDLLRLGE